MVACSPGRDEQVEVVPPCNKHSEEPDVFSHFLEQSALGLSQHAKSLQSSFRLHPTLSHDFHHNMEASMHRLLSAIERFRDEAYDASSKEKEAIVKSMIDSPNGSSSKPAGGPTAANGYHNHSGASHTDSSHHPADGDSHRLASEMPHDGHPVDCALLDETTAPQHSPADCVDGDSVPSGKANPLSIRRSGSGIRKINNDTSSLKGIVESQTFEIIFASIIMSNVLVMALYVQYASFDQAHRLGIPGAHSSQDTWPGMEVPFLIANMTFGVIFAVELSVKLVAQRKDFFKAGWNYLDSVVVLLWLCEQVGVGIIDANFIRILRLARLVRLVRMVKALEAVEPLLVLIGAIKASFPVLIWSTFVIGMVNTFFALLLNGLIGTFIDDPHIPLESRVEAWRYFGSFGRCSITMFELGLGNYVPVSRFLMDNVHEMFAWLLLAYKLVMGFAVVKVITAIFISETFKAAAADEEVLLIQRKKAAEILAKHCHTAFRGVDQDGDGQLSIDEFREALADTDIQELFHALEIEVSNPDLLFYMLDNSNGNSNSMITSEELLSWVIRCKGPARGADLMGVVCKLGQLFDRLCSMNETINVLRSNHQVLEKRLVHTQDILLRQEVEERLSKQWNVRGMDDADLPPPRPATPEAAEKRNETGATKFAELLKAAEKRNETGATKFAELLKEKEKLHSSSL